MFKNSKSVNYMACEQCFSQIIRPNQLYCKKCQVKTQCNKTSNRKLHKVKLNKNSSNLVEVLNAAKKHIDPNYSSNSLDDNSGLSIIQYTHKADNIHSYKWSNFQKIEEFGNCNIDYIQFPIIEFIYRLGDDLQSIPRIGRFIKDHKNRAKKDYTKLKPNHISDIASPLLLVLQKSFWRGLMESYFKFVHPDIILFSIVDFDPKTASEFLLSAIYFAGFVIQPDFPEEVVSYMHAYATNNIKKILLSVKLSNAQALGLYSYAFYLNGNTSLSRVCLSHLARVSHTLGICITRKSLPMLNQYNRKLISNNMRLYYNWAKMGPSSYELDSEDEEDDLDIYESKYQFPNSSLNFCSNKHEGALYSIYCSQFAKLKNLNINIISKFCKFDSKRIKIEIEGLNNKVNDVYKYAKLSLESVVSLAPEYESQNKKLEISKGTEYSITQVILDKGIELWELISSNTTFNDIWSWGPYTKAIISIH
ncbi:hypothetical protein CONCODRAFT_13591 [Conidiobolus coronatus NRRL 28638]|uniref:Transcription factor domain-containing protein n=1 Tax=Conidiobolus coronatus (strain ATCC 28846 / CBS 209.66 / NRRL 28638) TaxID=796925 RepID=A0A137NQF3_CONC2|nr:hypothetical protein CONCODRAFT_13591 [Conidiobolus coronatus NRRL 28638]|eukprot:KXN64987.1 hypothetical protein CONCODRAFT_13591 [Conidiobolus coronatus NRRL 28638]